jgi:hypothetical protein
MATQTNIVSIGILHLPVYIKKTWRSGLVEVPATIIFCFTLFTNGKAKAELLLLL